MAAEKREGAEHIAHEISNALSTSGTIVAQRSVTASVDHAERFAFPDRLSDFLQLRKANREIDRVISLLPSATEENRCAADCLRVDFRDHTVLRCAVSGRTTGAR